MQFVAPAEHYDRFMGRYAPTLAVAFCDATGVAAGMRALSANRQAFAPSGLTPELARTEGWTFGIL